MNEIPHSSWGISGGYEILHRRFGDQYAIFHRGSGDTHMLDRISFFVLDELNRSACSFEQLLENLSSEFEYESLGQLQKYLKSLMGELQKLTIIERLDT